MTAARPSQTLGSRAAAIRFFHRDARLASPTDQRLVRDLLEGARREDAARDHGRATVTSKRLAAALELQGPPATPIAIRDRAIPRGKAIAANDHRHRAVKPTVTPPRAAAP